MEEQCFRPQSSPIFTIPSLCPSCHVEGASKGVSGGAEAFIKTALHSVTWLLHVDSHILSCTCSQTMTFFSLIVAKTFQTENNRGNPLMHLICTNGAPYCQKKWEKDKKRGTLYLTTEHKLSWFRLLIGEGTFQCLNPILSFLREVDSCTWEKVMNWMTNKNKNSILFQPRSGSICSSSLVFMLIIVLNTIINDKKHHYNISLEKHCNTTYCTLMIPITTTMLIIFTEYYSSYFERKVCLRWFEVPPSPSSLISGCGDPDSCKGKASKRGLCRTNF